MNLHPIRIAALALACGVSGSAAFAGVFTVTNLNFSGPGSLSEAIELSNENDDASVINFSTGGTIQQFGELPRVVSPITINGGEAITIDGLGTTRLFRVGSDANLLGSDFNLAGDLTLNGIRVQNGGVLPSGSVLNRNPLTAGAGVFLEKGSLSVFNSTFLNNTAGNGAAIYALGGSGNQLTIERSNFFENNAETSFGGAVFVDSDQPWNPEGVKVSIDSSVFAGNRAAFGGGFAVRDNDRGAGAFSVTNTQFTGNAANGGAAAYNRETTILLDTLTLNNNDASLQSTPFNRGGGGFYFSNRSDATIRNTTITGSDADFGGAMAIFSGGNVKIEDSLIVRNNAEDDAVRGGDGAGIYILGGTDGARVSLLRSTVAENNAVNGFGGGILAADAQVEVIQSLIAGNTAGASGGGIYVDRVNGGLLLRNSTVTGNSTTGLLDLVPGLTEAGRGGGIYFITGHATIESSTIAGNTATERGGGLLLGGNENPAGRSTVLNTLFTENNAPFGPNIESSAAVLDSLGYNLLDDSGAGLFDELTDLLNAFADLQPLADNGGPTLTRALGNNSQAIDAGATDVSTDQRGSLRPGLEADDIGAFELALLRGDFNVDGVVDNLDIDLLAEAARGGSTNPIFDLNGDGLITFVANLTGVTSDSDLLVRTLLRTEYGDLNLDGRVDGDDFSTLVGQFGVGSAWSQGDTDGSGRVDGADFSRLVGKFGATSVALSSIPEPTAAILALLAVSPTCRRRGC